MSAIGENAARNVEVVRTLFEIDARGRTTSGTAYDPQPDTAGSKSFAHPIQL